MFGDLAHYGVSLNLCLIFILNLNTFLQIGYNNGCPVLLDCLAKRNLSRRGDLRHLRRNKEYVNHFLEQYARMLIFPMGQNWTRACGSFVPSSNKA